MFFLFLNLASKLFLLLCVRLLICPCAFSTDLLVNFFSCYFKSSWFYVSLFNSDRNIPLIEHVSYMGGETRCPPVSLGKQNSVEIPRELRGWHAGRKNNHEDCEGLRGIMQPLKIFDPRRERRTRQKSPSKPRLFGRWS